MELVSNQSSSEEVVAVKRLPRSQSLNSPYRADGRLSCQSPLKPRVVASGESGKENAQPLPARKNSGDVITVPSWYAKGEYSPCGSTTNRVGSQSPMVASNASAKLNMTWPGISNKIHPQAK